MAKWKLEMSAEILLRKNGLDENTPLKRRNLPENFTIGNKGYVTCFWLLIPGWPVEILWFPLNSRTVFMGLMPDSVLVPFFAGELRSHC